MKGKITDEEMSAIDEIMEYVYVNTEVDDEIVDSIGRLMSLGKKVNALRRSESCSNN